MTGKSDELLIFFKAMADANRLKIVSLLASKPHTVEQIAAALGLGESTVSHHLSRLTEAGLVSATAKSYYNYYQLHGKRIEEMAHNLLAGDSLPTVSMDAETEGDAYERKVVGNYLLPDGRLKTIPSQRKKLIAVLRHLARDFQSSRRYSEKEVNEILGRYHEDTARLRREMVGYRLMAREGGGGDYWLLEEAEKEPGKELGQG